MCLSRQNNSDAISVVVRYEVKFGFRVTYMGRERSQLMTTFKWC